MLATAPVGTGQWKNKDGGKQNGGNLYYIVLENDTFHGNCPSG